MNKPVMPDELDMQYLMDRLTIAELVLYDLILGISGSMPHMQNGLSQLINKRNESIDLLNGDLRARNDAKRSPT